MPPLTDRTLVVSGGSRGIGLAIELGAAGVTDLSRYGGGDNRILDIFVDKP
jgi:NAD(P)-dependent dehydrogenase (short-subunit alcohol dehydrogenase family)